MNFFHNLWDFFLDCSPYHNDSKSHTGCPKKNETGFLLNILPTKYRIFNSIFSLENWDQYANFEYKTSFVRFKGAEIFTKQNGVLKQINSFLCLSVVLRTALEWPLANRLTSEWPLTGTESPQSTLRFHRLSNFINTFQFMFISIIFQNSWEMKIKTNASSIWSPLSQTPFCFVNISAPLNHTEMVLHSKFAYGS